MEPEAPRSALLAANAPLFAHYLSGRALAATHDLQQQLRWRVIELLGVNRPDNTNIVNYRTQTR